MALFISVVNHNHDTLICEHGTLKNLAKKYNVILKSNTIPSKKLIKHCQENNIHLITNHQYKGFGTNNNDIFIYASSQLKMNSDDYFLVLNPDLIIDEVAISKLLILADHFNADISAINLYKDITKKEYDYSIRHYHSLFSTLKSLLGFKRNDFYDKKHIKKPIPIEWAAGSFLLFKFDCYYELKGFDEEYFMYFEDADICKRANDKGFRIIYFPQIEAIHLAAHDNRKLFSKHFKWYLLSMLKYHKIFK
ncbi:Rhamnosyltransferase WbbL [Vibrio ruber DSM 16370]|uniref:Rhamnosyltransferase WbbL n=1 Tax=Vibrio ruber (strain DSM 16370 / JCM 11486 / BCRC 17186 / CECT 7878 / LMG 23124 / VR1) TaxID=1123498 RepID=A0A1R4LLC2_VIBR1|nr:glycosyltransferase family 2 protein [Vibrio ruber]SJN57305.1 Rhamnosyltransferase WbbL [Vibrio ruber DSM 16370]